MQQDRNAASAPPALTARSVLLSLLLGNDPPQSPVAQLVRTAGLFGIADGAARTALSRMSKAGEIRAVDGAYELAAEPLLVRHRRQSASRTARTDAWVGRRWIQAVVAADRRSASERADARVRLTRARLAELREGIWLRPDNLGGRPDLPLDLHWFGVDPVHAAATLAARLWDLTAWSDRAELLLDAMSGLLGPLADGNERVLADGFVVSADVLRHFQADPLLPDELLPSGWPGHRLRDAYDEYDAAYRALLGAWFRTPA